MTCCRKEMGSKRLADPFDDAVQVTRDTYYFTTSEVQAKQAELQAQHRKQRLIQVRRQEKQHAELKRQQYKENCQELAVLEQASLGQVWHNQSRLALVELRQQLGASLAKTGQGQKAADAANQSAAVLAAQRTAERAAQLQTAKQRFAQALQLKHMEDSAAVAADVTRLQRISNTMAAESTRAHALAQHHRAIQAEAAANGSLPAATNWSEAALRAIDYSHTRLHELGSTVPSTVVVERNNDRGKAQCNEAAEKAVQQQARCAFVAAVNSNSLVQHDALDKASIGSSGKRKACSSDSRSSVVNKQLHMTGLCRSNWYLHVVKPGFTTCKYIYIIL